MAGNTKAQKVWPTEALPLSPTDHLIAVGERLLADFDKRFANESEAERTWLRMIINQVPDYLFVKDPESRFIFANNAVVIDNGFTYLHELIGKTDFDLHPRERAQSFFDIEQELLRSGTPRIDMEERVDCAGHGEKWMLTTKLPLRNEQGSIVGLIGIARDITARRRSDRLRAGHARLLEMIAAGAELKDVLDNLMREVEANLDAVQASVLLVDAEGEHLMLGSAPSLPNDYNSAVNGLTIGPSAGSCGTAAFRRQSVIVEDIRIDPLWANCRDIAAAHGLRSCWSTPILTRDRAVLGTLAIYSKRPRRPGSFEMQLIDMATHIAGIAIERKRAEERIHFMAHHDALTGLPNRVLLNDRITQATLHAQRNGRCVTLAFIDLDDFKNVNDTLGHDAGDELLKVMAQRLIECLRQSDTAARLGGDEFVVLLADQSTSAGAAHSMMRRIRAAIASPIEIKGQRLTVTSSIGVVSFPDDGEDAAMLLAEADKTMYRAKQAGRDNVQYHRADAQI